MEAYLQWKHKDRGQGARRLPRRPRRSVSCSFLQFSSLFGPKVPRVDLLGPLWIYYQRKARRVYSQKPSNRIGYPGVFCNILKLFEGYFRKRSRIWLKANGMIALVKFCKKFKVPTLPLYKFFFLSKDWCRTKRNPSNQKFVHLQKYRFHARKVEDSKHANYDVCERVWCCLTEYRPPAFRRPGPSQIKMYGFCRLFRAMHLLSWSDTCAALFFVNLFYGTIEELDFWSAGVIEVILFNLRQFKRFLRHPASKNRSTYLFFNWLWVCWTLIFCLCLCLCFATSIPKSKGVMRQSGWEQQRDTQCIPFLQTAFFNCLDGQKHKYLWTRKNGQFYRGSSIKEIFLGTKA